MSVVKKVKSPTCMEISHPNYKILIRFLEPHKKGTPSKYLVKDHVSVKVETNELIHINIMKSIIKIVGHGGVLANGFTSLPNVRADTRIFAKDLIFEECTTIVTVQYKNEDMKISPKLKSVKS